jgi:hypothetical protein
MVFVLVAWLTILGCAYVAYPLVSKRKYRYDFEDMFAFGDIRQLNYLNSKKAGVLANLADLNFEYEMGKLSDEDYNALREDYMEQAKAVIEQIDALKIREEIEELIESDVQYRRRTK